MVANQCFVARPALSPRPFTTVTGSRTGKRRHCFAHGIVTLNAKPFTPPKPTFLPSFNDRQQSSHLTRGKRLVHLLDEAVDEVLAVAKVTTLDEVLELAGTEATGGGGQLEGPQEVGDLLEVGADGVDLVDEVLNADDAVLAEVLLDDLVVGDGKALLVDLSVAALVDELADGLQVGVAVGDEGLDDLQHLGGGLGEADEDTVVDLEKTEELEGLALLGVDLVDTLDADDEGELGLSGDEEGAILLGLALGIDDVALGLDVLLVVLLGALEDGLALLLVGLRMS